MFTSDKGITLFYPMDWEATPRAGHEALLAQTMRWGVEQGVVYPGSPLYRSLQRMRSDLATALAYPDARGQNAQFISDFIGWYLLLDDALEAAEDLSRMTARFDECLAALTDPALRRPGASELVRGAMDLGARARALSSPAWRTRFLSSMRTYFYDGVLPEINHRVRGTLPSMTEYTELRVESSGSYPIFDLIEPAIGIELPPDIAAHPLIQHARKVAAVVISWANDVLSCHKERGPRGALNLPALLMADCGLSEGQALDVTVGIHNAEMRHYLSLKQDVLKVAALDCAAVHAWSRGLDVVMRGLLGWQLEAARYTYGRQLAVRVAGAGREGGACPTTLPLARTDG